MQCRFVARVLEIAVGGQMFTADEFEAFMDHQFDEPCADCARFDDVVKTAPDPAVGPKQQTSWQTGLERIWREGVPGAIEPADKRAEIAITEHRSGRLPERLESLVRFGRELIAQESVRGV